MKIALRNVSKQFGATSAVDALSLEVGTGELVSLVGGSGCGKTTTLRMIAGFERPDAGEIWFGDRIVNTVPPRKRGVGIVFQSYALFPTLTVAENIAFGLRVARWPEARIRERVGEMVELTKLTGLERATPTSSRGASSSGWPWPGRWPAAPTSCSSTSPCRPWTPRSVCACAPSCARSSKIWGSRPSTSRTTRKRRCPSPTASR